MARSQIPATLFVPPSIEIEGSVVARALGMDVDVFKQLMTDRKITMLCERGTGTDSGRYRASFYHGNRRVRLVVDEDGRVLSGPE
jgi:hypothetical protein